MLFLVIGFVNSLDRESVTVIDSETNTEKPIKGMQELEKSISLETYDSYEILGDSVNIKKDIISHRALGTNLSLSRTVFSTFKIYDFKTYKNGELDYELPYIFFEEDKEAEGACKGIRMKSTDIAPTFINSEEKYSFEYKVGNLIESVEGISVFYNVLYKLGLSGETSFPFDLYRLNYGSSPVMYKYKSFARVILPNTFKVLNNSMYQTKYSCANMSSKMYEVTVDLGENNECNINITVRENRKEITEIVETESQLTSVVQSKDSSAVLFEPIISSQDLFFDESTGQLIPQIEKEYNTSNLGCFVDVYFERTPIIKYIFIFSALFILLICIISVRPLNLANMFEYSFVIWAFQEALLQFNMIERPNSITLFDLTILIPFLVLVGYLLFKGVNFVVEYKNEIYNFLTNVKRHLRTRKSKSFKKTKKSK